MQMNISPGYLWSDGCEKTEGPIYVLLHLLCWEPLPQLLYLENFDSSSITSAL